MRKARYWITSIITLPLFMIIQPSVSSPTADHLSVLPKAQVSLTFDDGYDGTVRAAQILATKGYKGTAYLVPGYIGQLEYITWEQANELQDKYGWEIGAHSMTHPELSQLATSQIDQELAQSKRVLADHGLIATNFASPYGDYDKRVLVTAAKYYRSHRGFHDLGANFWPYNNALLQVRHIEGTTPPETVKAYIQDAIKNRVWLIFVFHQIKDNPSPDPEEFEYSAASLHSIVDYLAKSKVSVVTINQGLEQKAIDHFAADALENGIKDGWWTDAPQTITFDSNSHGVWPKPETSIRLQSSDKDTHLFSPKVAVELGKLYGIKTFLTVDSITPGKQVGFYVDEYDAKGYWVSGKYYGGTNEEYVEEVNFTYSPSSSRVTTARLQIIVEGKSGTVAYIDSPHWLELR